MTHEKLRRGLSGFVVKWLGLEHFCYLSTISTRPKVVCIFVCFDSAEGFRCFGLQGILSVVWPLTTIFRSDSGLVNTAVYIPGSHQLIQLLLEFRRFCERTDCPSSRHRLFLKTESESDLYKTGISAHLLFDQGKLLLRGSRRLDESRQEWL